MKKKTTTIEAKKEEKLHVNSHILLREAHLHGMYLVHATKIMN